MTKYTEILMCEPTDHKFKSDMAAIKVLSKLAEPNRQLFSDYCIENNRRNPAVVITEYMESLGASPMGVRMANQIKDVVLKGLKTNSHKGAILGAIGQAYFDLCLAVSIAQYCRIDDGVDLPYSQYVTLAKESINILMPNLLSFQKMIKQFGDTWYEGEWSVLSKEGFSIELANRRIDTAITILNMWSTRKFNYIEEYEDLSKTVEKEDEKKFARLNAEIEFKDLVLDAYTMEDFDLNRPECEELRSRMIELKAEHGFDMVSVKEELGL